VSSGLAERANATNDGVKDALNDGVKKRLKHAPEPPRPLIEVNERRP
jgi:hypothetical protein